MKIGDIIRLCAEQAGFSGNCSGQMFERRRILFCVYVCLISTIVYCSIKERQRATDENISYYSSIQRSGKY